MSADALFPGETTHRKLFLGNINFGLFVSGKYREVRFLFVSENPHD